MSIKSPKKHPDTGNRCYFVSGVSQTPLRHRCWGFYHDAEEAMEVIRNNEGDFYEAGWYPLGMMAEIEEGVGAIAQKTTWFKYDAASGRYHDVEQPEWTKRYGWSGFPELRVRDPKKHPDTERLDWLERSYGPPTAKEIDDIVNGLKWRGTYYGDLREAIDAAIKETTAPHKEKP